MLLALSLACGKPTYNHPDKVPGPPEAGAAEVVLDAPMGAPMGGYSSRCKILGHESKPDKRLSPYTVAFAQSAGLHTRPKVKAIWLDNGDDVLVLLKFDAIYSYDGLVSEIERRLSEELGRNLSGKVVLAASHSHAMPANFSDQVHFYLGGDMYNREVFERYAAGMTEAALLAHDRKEPAAIGANWLYEWDPDDRVYRDRREENDTLQVWEDQEIGRSKDQHALILRVDNAAGDPLAMAVVFGMHGTILGGDSSMWSHDSTGGVEVALEEQFDDPDVVVMHLQGAGGDASPAGSDDDLARTETIGVYAVDALMDGWEETPTTSDDIDLEVASRHIPSHRDDIRVTRDGTVDWYYPPFEEGYQADDEIYADDGSLSSPFDEFAVFEFGAAFCGSEDPLLKVETQADVYPYTSCMDIGLLSGLISGTFGMIVEEFELPMVESMKAGTTGIAIDGMPVRGTSGAVSDTTLLIGTFPAEPASMFTEQWRRRAVDELGIEIPGLIGYAQDHEGYLLIPEDWLVGGYEPNINIWGPLQAEYLMEQVLDYAGTLLGNGIHEPLDPLGQWVPTVYPDRDLPERHPDPTPGAGSRLLEVGEDFWIPLDLTLDLDVPASIPRVTGIVQLAWEGGDPVVDQPTVTLQRKNGQTWEGVTSRSGRDITEVFGDILLAHTPTPLYPAEAEQTHQWWAGWQAVGHVQDKSGLPEGTYRLHVAGKRATGQEDRWPWETAPYTVEGPEFQVVPAALDVVAVADGLEVSLSAPALGWRLLDMEGSSRGSNPVRGQVVVSWESGGAADSSQVEATVVGDRSHLAVVLPADATGVAVTDAFGNSGTLP